MHIPTYNGHKLDPINPDPNEIDIRDIAHALSMDCRYGGHLIRHYSVGEHSVRLSYAVPKKYAKTALMHDATEAYMRDIPWPIKVLPMMRGYRRAEDNLCEVIFEKFGIPTVNDEFDHYDKAMWIPEAEQLHPYPENMPSKTAKEKKLIEPIGAEFKEYFKTKSRFRTWGWEPKYAEVAFLDRAKELGIII